MAVRFLQGVKFSGGTIRFADPVVVPEVPFTVETFTTTGAGTWVKPLGITEVVVECWGGGGAGGGAGTNTGGDGGAGAQYAKKTIIYGSAQQSISYSVAASVAGTTGNGATGNDTTWQTNVVVAKGGAGGLGSQTSGPGSTGSTTGGIGDVVYAGGSSQGGTYFPPGLGDAFANGGTGGGGAGSTGDTLAEIGTPEFGGDGGGTVGVIAGGLPGNPGSNYGGGGGGAAKLSGANRAGGAGAQGLIRISYR